MKNLTLLLIIFGTAGCGSIKSENAPQPYRAAVVQAHAVPVTKDPGSIPDFTLSPVSLETLESLDSLSGKYVYFKEGGELLVQRVNGTVIEADHFSGGSTPYLSYKVEDGVIYAQDYPTLVMLSAFYNFEQVFLNLNILTGFSADDFKNRYGKIEILFEPVIQQDDEGKSSEIMVKLNAAYVSGQKQFVLFRRSSLENIPLGANLQVIAHEFGHIFWEHAFFGGSFDECDRFQSEWVMKGLNEGFADYMSYSLTGSSDVLSASIDTISGMDERDFTTIDFTYSNMKSKCSHSFYCVGTLFAKALYLTAREVGFVMDDVRTRGAFMKEVVKALSKTQASMVLSQLPIRRDSCGEKDPTLAEDDPLVIGTFLQAFIVNFEGSYRKALCRRLDDAFGTQGFPAKFRDGCPK